jgi:hypothetical protein
VPGYRATFTFTLCFSQETAILSLNGIKRLFFVMKAQSDLRGILLLLLLFIAFMQGI